MTRTQFDQRLFEEAVTFVQLCADTKVWLHVRAICPERTSTFAEKLILDLSKEQARARIMSNPEGVGGFVLLAVAILRDRKNRPFLASNMPSTSLTPFYLLSSVVIDAVRAAAQLKLKGRNLSSEAFE